MKCNKCGKDCEKKVNGLFYCYNCKKPAAEFCECEDEVLELGGLCGDYGICEKCGKAFPESMR